MDIKSGEYVRTYDGRIYKISYYSAEEKRYISVTEDDWYPVYESEIKSHSENILDLIEVGDYVNGHKVYETDDGLVIFDIDDTQYFVNPLTLSLDKYKTVLKWKDEDFINSIVTKEQFDREKYIVGE